MTICINCESPIREDGFATTQGRFHAGCWVGVIREANRTGVAWEVVTARGRRVRHQAATS